MSRTIVAVTAVLALITGAATANEVTLNPVDDAAISARHPDTNYGAEYRAWVGYDSGWADSLVYFDLSDYMGIIVEEATLELYVNDHWGTIPDRNWVNLVDGTWDEDTVTWNTSPGYNNNHSLYFPAPTEGSWLSLDVEDFVEDWVDGTYNNYGFYLRQLDEFYCGFYFYTKEKAGNRKPKLTITYQESDVETTSFGRIKALFD
jgi:hypothetical protein